MPFSSLRDPVDIARAQGALDAAWDQIQRRSLPFLGSPEAERTRLAYIVAGLLHATASDSDLVEAAVSRFVSKHHSDHGTGDSA
jgi:hypothetical protein